MNRAANPGANPLPGVTLVAFDQDLLSTSAGLILAHHRESLPDLSRCCILVAEENCAPQLRAEMLSQARALGFDALLGPRIETLDHWLKHTSPVRGSVLSRPAQELVLADALRNAASIYTDTDPWLLADQLLVLFDELTHSAAPPDTELEDFVARLQQGYGVDTVSRPLQSEAYILHTLWHAWRRQLAGEDLLDTATAAHQRLAASLDLVGDTTLWLLGYTGFTSTEAGWLKILLQRNQARLILHGDTRGSGYHPDTPIRTILEQLGEEPTTPGEIPTDGFSDFLDNVFRHPAADNLARRAQQFALRQQQDPVRSRLAVLRADSAEQEAQAVALQVRRLLLDNVMPIAIVTSDRRLARRVRALLEISAIELDDSGGWALSTTSAAATLERWLECIEEDFACVPLLDVLKSPFVSFTERDAHLASVRRLEQDIILHENIARGLDRYRRHLELRSERLPDWSEPVRRSVQQMLNTLDHAASPLTSLRLGEHTVQDFLIAVDESLSELGARALLEADDAGQQLLELLSQLHQAGEQCAMTLDWPEFRDWLGRNLERATFRSSANASPVRLLTLEQTRAQRFAATIICGCSSEHLPGHPAGGVFFNQRVRSELGLPDWSQSLSLKLHHFCRLLHSGGRVLMTCTREEDGEPVAASPWLDLLDVFYRFAYRKSLDDTLLNQLAADPRARPATPDSAPLPDRQDRPTPRPAPVLQPQSWSAYTHQRLVDCPYRFFAADALKLKPADEIREALSKSDYGSLVHRITQAFNSRVPGLPGPWTDTLDAAQRPQALELLKRISERVFADAIRDNFQARGWFQQWMRIMPAYLDWEIARRAEWQLRDVEFDAQLSLHPKLHMKGRIDRIDQHDGDIALVDYKTGQPPRAQDVLEGEAVQLPSYALLMEQTVSQLDYIEFGRDKVAASTAAQDAELQQLLNRMRARLVDLADALQDGAALPAWGDPGVCKWCEFSGVCRRDMWLHGAAGND